MKDLFMLKETEFIKKYIKKGSEHNKYSLNFDDDIAVVDNYAYSTDTISEEIHFFNDDDPYRDFHPTEGIFSGIEFFNPSLGICEELATGQPNEDYENLSREFYGGAIGFMGFNGDFNHAIIIRSFLSKNRRLFYQAGAGIVFKSNRDRENQEVYNKIEALRKAIQIAEKI